MNTHKNARLTAQGRRALIVRITSVGIHAAARDFAISTRTAFKWLARYRAEGESGLVDRSSRPKRLRSTLSESVGQQALSLRNQRLTIRTIAHELNLAYSTLRRWFAKQGLNRLPALQVPPPVQRYEHEHPGDLLHLDIKKLGRIVRPGHRMTGDPRDRTDRAGWEYVHVAIDDHSRLAFTGTYPDERAASAVAFLHAAVGWYASLGITIRRLLTDNGSAYRSYVFAAACRELGIKHRFTRPYTPRTNGKAERFIQTALREWAYAATYANSTERQIRLASWLHRYNHHRPHSALGYRPPISRAGVNNLSDINT